MTLLLLAGWEEMFHVVLNHGITSYNKSLMSMPGHQLLWLPMKQLLLAAHGTLFSSHRSSSISISMGDRDVYDDGGAAR